MDKGSAQIHPAERDINRMALLDAAPDREALLLGDKSIKEIRQLLKIVTCGVNGQGDDPPCVVPPRATNFLLILDFVGIGFPEATDTQAVNWSRELPCASPQLFSR